MSAGAEYSTWRASERLGDQVERVGAPLGLLAGGARPCGPASGPSRPGRSRRTPRRRARRPPRRVRSGQRRSGSCASRAARSRSGRSRRGRARAGGRTGCRRRARRWEARWPCRAARTARSLRTRRTRRRDRYAAGRRPEASRIRSHSPRRPSCDRRRRRARFVAQVLERRRPGGAEPRLGRHLEVEAHDGRAVGAGLVETCKVVGREKVEAGCRGAAAEFGEQRVALFGGEGGHRVGKRGRGRGEGERKRGRRRRCLVPACLLRRPAAGRRCRSRRPNRRRARRRRSPIRARSPSRARFISAAASLSEALRIWATSESDTLELVVEHDGLGGVRRRRRRPPARRARRRVRLVAVHLSRRRRARAGR